MKNHIEGFSKKAEEAGCELQSSVGGDMLGNAMLRKYMCDGKDSQILKGTMNSCWNEYSLFSESVNNH